jgi:dihydrofolate reductase
VGTVIMHNVASVDGFIADENDDVGPLHDWASYHFVDGVTAAIDKAQKLAGERTVAVNAGDVGAQILAAGLVNEVAMDLVPVVFGSGKRYFGNIDGQHLLEDPHVVIQGDRVLHLKFKVRR